ncbi:hypothetical protein N7452_011084 [Penicillium brevicompactum]|uniref:5'-3' DNA helicase ZGRF1-like N-terminal domain-containing protein n=1 Tax=Penicillium brevicompactum TaxID=5074 RepID=A0A9W9Q1J2_PENBR|nr:hypothetical protein N7452_011084 [Penicillium brevicompactum]
MSTPSSSTRKPPHSPQVTASVAKFRCLYSHDLRRKSKRWHDGHLRYHKHNKRVMVYDDSGNFIGDHHWRSLDEVQDGDEMELDKGVLIEVGENMGITETDISNLYEKKRSSQGSPQSRDPVPSAPSASAATPTPRYGGSSQSYRSLTDLLGIKKTPVNPFASPYEQRHAVPTPPRDTGPEPAPKRQKTSAVNQTTESPHTHGQIIDLTQSNPGGNPTRASNSSASQLTRIGGRSTIETPTSITQGPALSQRANPPRPDLPTAARRSVPAVSQPGANLPSPEGSTRPIHRPITPSRPSNGTTTTAPPAQPRRTTGTLPESNSAVPSEQEPPRPRGTLRAPETSRIRENRPKAAPTKPPAPPKPPTPPRPPAPPKPPTQKPDLPPSGTDVSMTVEAPHSRETPASKEPAISCEDRQQSAQLPTKPQERPSVSKNPPLASSNAPNSRPKAAHSSPTVSNSEPENTTNVPTPSNMPPPARPVSRKPSETTPGGLRMGGGRPRKKLMYSALLPGASRTPSPTTSSSPLGSGNDPPTIEPQEPDMNSDLVGPIDSTASDEFVPTSSTRLIFDEILNGSTLSSSPPAARGRRSHDSTFRKSFSDPTALAGLRGNRDLITETNTDKRVTKGAWSSEALDLFDYWPAGREKPSE